MLLLGIPYFSDFNSQPHEEADLDILLTLTRLSISTHSLTKRLTLCSLVSTCITIISTHSLTKRLTETRRIRAAAFQISTHSLTKRLTANGIHFIRPIKHFNSQPHEEADNCCPKLSPHLTAFQLTASRRG